MKDAHIHGHQACNNKKTVILFESTGHNTTCVSADQENAVTFSGTKLAVWLKTLLDHYSGTQITKLQPTACTSHL
jgi:hypothetical protein